MAVEREVIIMTKEELNKIIGESHNEILKYAAEKLPNKLREYSSNNKTISTEELTLFLLIESLDTNKRFLHSVLEKALVKD